MASKLKFTYNINFQWIILSYITQFPLESFKVLNILREDYFELLEQKIIFKALNSHYQKHNKIPSAEFFPEVLKRTLKQKSYINTLKPEDKSNIIKKGKSLYRKKLDNPQEIIEACYKFSSYVELRGILNQYDITDFDTYGEFSNRIQRAVNNSLPEDNNKGISVVSDIRARLAKRHLVNDIIPTPFWQLNNITNGGGFTKGSVISILDKGKGGKTKVLINIARGYLRVRKKVLYIDLENGEEALATRIDQSVIGKPKREILSGQYDKALQKAYRKYKRFGSELTIRRLPSLSTTSNTLQAEIDYFKLKGIIFDIIIIDYIAAMGSTLNSQDDNARISGAYIDCKNLAQKNNIEAIWTGHHTTREAMKRRHTKYEPNDTSKCIDVHRHVDAMLGINQNNEEKENNVIRLEVVDIRDGVADGRAYFWDDPICQRVTEFNRAQVKKLLEDAHNPEIPKKSTLKSDLDAEENS